MNQENKTTPFSNLDDDLQNNEFQFWTVADNGDIGRPDRTDIQIPKEKLLSQNWLTHVIAKERHPNTDSAEKEFYFVLMEALRRAGYKRITINLENLYEPIIGELTMCCNNSDDGKDNFADDKAILDPEDNTTV